MSCGINCRFAQNCFFRKEKPKDDDPKNCPEYWKLEDYWWDAMNDREPDELPFEDDPDDDEDYSAEELP